MQESHSHKMPVNERTYLIQTNRTSSNTELSLIFAIICIVDVFGVFPIISLPKPIIDCGYIGIMIVIVIISLQIYTSSLLGKCWLIAEKIEPDIQFKNRYPYSALAELTYGSKISKIITVLLDVTVFGGGIPNLIVASRNLQLLGLKLTDNSFNMSFCYWILIVGIIMCPILWFRSPKDMRILCTISVSLVFLVFILTFTSIFLNVTESTKVPTASMANSFPLWQNILTAYGILVFQFDIHPTILTIQVDMKEKGQIYSAIFYGFLTSVALFLLTTGAIYNRYGNNIDPSILEMLPNTVPLYVITLLVALQLGLSSAISNTSLYQHLDDCMGISRDFNYKRYCVRSVVAFLSIIVAESVPRFDLVMSLIGGALTGPLVFIFPPLFYLRMIHLKDGYHKLLQMENVYNIVHVAGTGDSPYSSSSEVDEEPTAQNESKMLDWFICGWIITFGVAATIATTYLNIVSTTSYVTFSPPCIYRIYNATINA